jgi:hypothetical protein
MKGPIQRADHDRLSELRKPDNVYGNSVNQRDPDRSSGRSPGLGSDAGAGTGIGRSNRWPHRIGTQAIVVSRRWPYSGPGVHRSMRPS